MKTSAIPTTLGGFLLASLLTIATPAHAQNTNGTTTSGSVFPCNPDAAAHYTAYRVRQHITINGIPDEPCWQAAPRSPRFVDILSGKPTSHDTHAAVLWDEKNLYVAYWVEEPDVEATLKKHNDPIWQNNDVEVFIAGKDAYYEFELNAFNTVYEAFFMWEDTYERDGFSKVPEFRRSNPEVKAFNGVGFTTHPRGPRLGSWAWRFPGLKTAVHIDGTLNDKRDKDKGWTVDLAFPWKGMTWLAKADNRALPPNDGDVWRIDFSRFNQHKAPPPQVDSGGWFWSPHGVWDSHIPECFPYIHFSTNEVTAPHKPRPR
jgi:hypothetical protein